MQMWSRFLNSTVVGLPLDRGFSCCSSQSISHKLSLHFIHPLPILTMYRMLWTPVYSSYINHWAVQTHYSVLFFALYFTSVDKSYRKQEIINKIQNFQLFCHLLSVGIKHLTCHIWRHRNSHLYSALIDIILSPKHLIFFDGKLFLLFARSRSVKMPKEQVKNHTPC